MDIQSFDRAVKLCDDLSAGDAYEVRLTLRNGSQWKGAWHRRDDNMVQLDMGTENEVPVFISIAAIDVVQYLDA